jgi:anti-anti-sigma factor
MITMDVRVSRRDGVLVFVLDGRLDGHGSGILGDAIKSSFHDDDRAAAVDMSSVEYLSSSGIRILLTLAKEVKRRGGVMALAGVRDYPLKVLKMAGFHSVFSIVQTIDDAIRICGKGEMTLSLIDELSSHKSVKYGGVTYQIERAGTGTARLKVRGSLSTLLHSRITRDDLTEATFTSIRYSIGLGALGPDAESALPLLGEMITLHGSMVWLPTDGNNTPDFLAPAGSDQGIPVYTAFNVTLEGPFHEYISFDADDPEGISLEDLYRQIFSSAKVRRKDFKGVIALAISGVTSGMTGSGLLRSPLKENAGELKGTIMDEDAVGDWCLINFDPLYEGDTLVSFGVGVDTTADLSVYDPVALHSLAYIHPAHKGATNQHLHNHGVIFRGIPWERNVNIERQIQTLINDAEVVDMRHLLNSTRFRRGRIGVAYVSEITEE